METSRIAPSYCGKLISGVREKQAAADQAAAPLSLRAKMLMSAYLPECRADGMADVRDLKSRGDFPRVGSTPTPGTTSLGKPANNAIVRVLQGFCTFGSATLCNEMRGKSRFLGLMDTVAT